MLPWISQCSFRNTPTFSFPRLCAVFFLQSSHSTTTFWAAEPLYKLLSLPMAVSCTFLFSPKWFFIYKSAPCNISLQGPLSQSACSSSSSSPVSETVIKSKTFLVSSHLFTLWKHLLIGFEPSFSSMGKMRRDSLSGCVGIGILS